MSSEQINNNYITTSNCDSCGRKGPVVLFHSNGTPVLAECTSCNPLAFDAFSRKAIDQWLFTGNTAAL